MSITAYISHTFQDQEKESEFQYQAQHPKEHYDSSPEELEREIGDFYSDYAYNGELLKSKRHRFLDYHLNKYEGEDMDFFDFIISSPSRVRHRKDDSYEFEYIGSLGSKVHFLAEWVEKAKKEEEERKRFTLGDEDFRLAGNLPNDVIEAYFMGVFTAKSRSGKNKGKQILSPEGVRLFLGANFDGFPYSPLKEKLKTNAPQNYIKRAVYLFYEKHRFTKRNEASRYCELLIKSFDDFDRYASPRTLLNSFGELVDKQTEHFLGNYLGRLLGK